ncbi:cache domain-containing protein [Polaromonas sp. P1(28)-13]|nr:cache domain-containing protein [Polaromonas sp. P1(28)-13]
MRVATDSTAAGRRAGGDRAYFRDAVARRGFVAGEYIVGRLTGKPSITFALPVLDGDGRVVIVAYASLDLVEMAKSVTEIQMPPGAQLTIIDRNGTVLAAKPERSSGRVGQKIASPVLQQAVKSMSTGVREGMDGAGQERLFAFLPSSPFADAAFLWRSALTATWWWGRASASCGLSWLCWRWWHF